VKLINGNMKTIKLIIFSLLLSVVAVKAQTIKEAIKYSDREQYQKAKNILSGLVKTDTKGTDQYYYLGDIYFKNEQYDSARYWFMQAVKLNENSALNYVGLGKVSMTTNPTEGKANFDKAVSLAKKDGRVYAAIAEYYINLDKPDGAKAIEYASKGVEVDPKNAWAKLILGDAYFASNDGTKAIEQYKASLALDPKSPLPLWKIGKLYLAAKNYDVGMQSFKEGLVLDVDFSPIYREMGELYYRAKKFDKAIESYKKYLELRDKSDETDFRYASFLFLNEDYTNALTILNALAKKDFNNSRIYRIMAYSQYETKDYNSALQNMDIFWKKTEAKKIISQDYEYYGKILSKKGQDSLAVEYLNKAVEKDTSKKEIYGDIANMWFTAKRYDKAAAAFQRKIDMTKATAKPTAMANDYLSMGRAYMLNKKYTAADSAFAKVTELKPELPIGYLYRAKANANIDPKQEKALAKPYYEKYIELAKVDTEKNKKELVEAYTYLGSYYLLVNKDKAKSDEAWNNVRTLDPTNKAAAEAAKMK
jgi:tetratricopeptide (TPR) repeat protein